MGLTPMMQQYLETHEKVKDAILFFRLGDFYEMFFDDALKASKELEIALTGRECGLDEKAPMCGVPYHSAESYITKLVEKGYKVAICEQVEDPALAKGIVKREIIRVISPGTIADGKLLESKKNNYLMSLYQDKNTLGLAYLDISTGDFFVTELSGKNVQELLMDEIGKIGPSEILVNPNLFRDSAAIKLLEERFGIMTNLYPAKYFEYKSAEKRIKEQFDVYSLTALGLEKKEYCVRAAGALLQYIDETQKRVLTHINHVAYYENDAYMILDLSTRKNLELTETLRSGEKKGSLLWVLDRTVTAMGGRMLRRWLEAPLLSKEAITERQDQVEELYKNPGALPDMKAVLMKVYDLERICGKISFGTCTPKDLLSLKQSVGALPALREFINSIDAPRLRERYGGSDLLTDIYELIDASIDDDAPFVLKEGRVIKGGYNAEIDEYREASEKGKDWIRDLEAKERERSGIKSLKVKYNRVFGYFIEITKSNLDQTPEDYIRKQTLANSERFFTPELKEMETKILGAEERLGQLEYEVFQGVREQIIAQIVRIQRCAKEIAECDALYSLAQVAIANHYVKPEITDDRRLVIKNGRHPVVEALIGENRFVTNDADFDGEDLRMMLITGPNMAGKSTYIRQVAVLTLMAQIGSFIPADSATIGVVDRIFTRVGASDDLATGQSTFMVEMTEVSNILKNATADSLVILDEIGRGTSTFDGISIAWAVVEYLWDPQIIGAKTLFATHYHELTELESLKAGIKNYSIGVKETADGVVFLRKIKPGSADQSYGIEVAELAGFPRAVTSRAREILKVLGEGENTYREGMIAAQPPEAAQINFLDIMQPPALPEEETAVLDCIRSLSINEMTPMEAMNQLYALKKQLD
ncbi:MAG: DNA mismatch repair protein MutS [Eubacterium sp.]|nr:DNA mismatch repair protein MutS [Eubacterium sp.]